MIAVKECELPVKDDDDELFKLMAAAAKSVKYERQRSSESVIHLLWLGCCCSVSYSSADQALTIDSNIHCVCITQKNKATHFKGQPKM